MNAPGSAQDVALQASAAAAEQVSAPKAKAEMCHGQQMSYPLLVSFKSEQDIFPVTFS